MFFRIIYLKCLRFFLWFFGQILKGSGGNIIIFALCSVLVQTNFINLIFQENQPNFVPLCCWIVVFYNNYIFMGKKTNQKQLFLSHCTSKPKLNYEIKFAPSHFLLDTHQNSMSHSLSQNCTIQSLQVDWFQVNSISDCSYVKRSIAHLCVRAPDTYMWQKN